MYYSRLVRPKGLDKCVRKREKKKLKTHKTRKKNYVKTCASVPECLVCLVVNLYVRFYDCVSFHFATSPHFVRKSITIGLKRKTFCLQLVLVVIVFSSRENVFWPNETYNCGQTSRPHTCKSLYKLHYFKHIN